MSGPSCVYILEQVKLICTIFLPVCAAALTTSQKKLFEDNSVTVSTSGSNYVFSHHGVPSHTHGPFPNADNPNEVSTQNHQFTIPQNPTVETSPGACLDMGEIGMAVNGIPLYNPYTLEGYDAVSGEHREIFDDCDGHPQQFGAYHYHKIPGCLSNSGNDQILGIALDGYLIYGPKDADGNELKSKDLDYCHGKTVNGVYRYHMTTDFPYILGCYHGKVVHSKSPPGGQQPPAGQQPPSGGQDTCKFATATEYTGDGADGNSGSGNLVVKAHHTISIAIMIVFTALL